VKSATKNVEVAVDTGLLIERLVFGLLIAVHGSQKLFGWFGGPGMSGTATFFEGLLFRPARPFVVAAGIAECSGGVLLAVGLFTPGAAAAIISVMIVAIVTVHWRNGLLAISNGIELPFLYAVTAVSLTFTGPGNFSIDALLGLTEWWTPEITATVLAAGVFGALVSLGMRRRASEWAHV
jgi:putative oxidoreductase